MTSNGDSFRADKRENSPTEGPHRVVVEGREQIVVSDPRTDDLPRTTRTYTVECASGERTTDAWTGVPVSALVEAAEVPGGTTHLRVEADDVAAQVPIRAALDGMVAFDREEGTDGGAGLPRFVASGVPGERLVKRVRRVSAVELAPDEDLLVG